MADINVEQLSAFWKQPTDNYGQYDASTKVATFQEVWKGSMTMVMALYHKIQNWQPEGVFDSYKYSDFIQDADLENLKQAYTHPQLPSGLEWSLIDAHVTELPAGDNAELHLTWGTTTINVDPGTEDPVFTESWNLQWQSQSYSLYAYCGNLSTHLSSENDRGMRGKIASRTALENWYNQAQQYGILKQNMQFTDGQIVNISLNPAEINIAEKINIGKTNPIFHYPILTHIQTTECQTSKLSATLKKSESKLEKPDYIAPLEEPFDIPRPPNTSPDKWTWLCQGSNVNVTNNPKTKKSTIQITTQYWGAAGEYDKELSPGSGWDTNFYGNGSERWIFGQA